MKPNNILDIKKKVIDMQEEFSLTVENKENEFKRKLFIWEENVTNFIYFLN